MLVYRLILLIHSGILANLGNKIIADTCDPSDAAAMKKLLNETISNVRDEG